MRAQRRDGGYSLVEMLVVTASAVLVLGGSMALLIGSRGAFQVGGTESSLQEVGRRILDDVLEELRSSGLTTVGSQSYPAIFERPAAIEEESERGPLVATMNYTDIDDVSETLAYEGEGGPNRIVRNAERICNEIAFQVPADVDGDGRPIDAEGSLEWPDEVISYRVITDTSGTNWVRRVVEDSTGNRLSARPVGPWVTNMTFDVILNDRSMRFGAVAVVIYLQRQSATGQTITAALEGMVVLRNTREL